LQLLPDFAVNIHIDPIGKFRIRIRRNRSYWLRDPLALEQFPLAALQSLLRPGSVVYDVGANIGLYTRFCVNRFAARKVIAFEPMGENRSQLAQNIELGKITEETTVLPYAIGNLDGEVELQIDDLSSGSATLDVVTRGEAAPGRKQYGFPPKKASVMCRRLDSLIPELDLPVPDLIKVDIEGAEALFVEGASTLLQRLSPKLLIELHGASFAKQVYELLSQLGYYCAGRVSEKFDKSGYAFLDASMVSKADDLYDIHFLVASKNRADLPDKLPAFTSRPS
jgi:FkbM family methyltransferase